MIQLLWEKRKGLNEFALVSGGKLTDYRVFPDEGVFPEQVYLARVDRIARGMDAAFLRLPGDIPGFLPLAEAKEPLAGGQLVPVQVKKPPVGEKAAYLTQDISLAGRYLILLPMSSRAAVSSRVTDLKQKERLLEIARSLRPDGMGLILRRESAGAAHEQLTRELQRLSDLWDSLTGLLKKSAAPALLWNGRPPLERALEDWEQADQLTADDESLRAQCEGMPFQYHPVPFSLFSVREQRSRLLARRVWLPSGGYLVVDPCEALTVIDVNTGKAPARGKDREELFLKTNLEAVRVIGRLLRVRGVGGIIVIDLIDMEREASRARVLEEMNLVVLTDPVKCVVHGFTSLGLLEMTRKKTDVAPYHHQTQAAPCPHCGGTGLIAEGNAHDTENLPG